MDARTWWPTPRTWLATGAVIALVAAVGSLYFSDGLGLYPCELCWYQRILMYPLVVVLGIAALERRSGVYRTALALSVPGVAVAAYHSWLQSASNGVCAVGGGCATVQYRLFDLLTIPDLALIAFALISLIVLAVAYEP